ncbi:DNA polymerase III subunit alpha [Pedobacter insulae]|uniref:DNA-directed DNA polymerase n=1 Tax=Pedobacter insulae TaxID=414048 RepID=A0A1I3AJB0_9SPHI|nr:DNA polymerase III subunit alpha [Pedobacter insulae]SFH50157.1 DNA polymerase III, alpha subunit [Pedobacter insulae]
MFLNIHSQYSLRYGTMDIKTLIAEAREKGIHEMVLTDINNSTGCMEFIRLCRKEGMDEQDDAGNIIKPAYYLKPIIGIEFRRNNQLLYIGIAKNKEGMRALNEFLTFHNLNQMSLPDEAPPFVDAFIVYPYSKRTGLKDNEYLGIRPNEVNKITGLSLMGMEDKLVILQPITVKNRVEHRLHKYLRAIGLSTVLGKLEPGDYCEPDEVFVTERNIQERFERYNFMIANTKRLLSCCCMDDYTFGHKNKKTFTGSTHDDLSLLTKLAMEGSTYRYGINNKEAIVRIKKELKVIAELNFCAYFLITWDIVNYAMSKGYYHVGRGSGANSIVAYCLKITDVDPIDLDLYFERFLNHKRSSPPDFDLDFSWDEREDVQDYIFKRYQGANTALLGTMSTFKDNAIIREIGKVMGLPKSEIDSFTDPTKNQLHANNDVFNKLLQINSRMKGMPNQRSIHAGGILISEEPLSYYTALDLPPKGMPTVQWDMYEAELIGLDKFDILSQRGIGHIKEAVQLVLKNKKEKVDIHDFKSFKTDPKLNSQLRAGTPIGCFYIESPAMRQLLKKLLCEDYLTLVAASSIIRPGVASSGMMKMYIQSYHSPDKVQYLHPVMKEQLAETFGVMVYQEDVIKICHHYAGLDMADADILRRGMSGKYRAKIEFDKLVARFFDKAKEKGRDEKITKEVWRQVSSFAGYSFSKAHSASFAVESYQSLYLKTYYPMEFMVAVLNNYGGFYQRWVYVHALQQTGAKVHLPCVNRSDSVVNIKKTEVYLGLIGIQGLENSLIEIIPNERKENGNYRDLEDLIRRTQLALEQAVILIRVGALRFTGKDKKELLWEIHNYLGNKTKVVSDKMLFHFPPKEYVLPDLENNMIEDAYQELELLGFPITLTMFDLLKTSYRGDVFAKDLEQYQGKVVKMLGNFVCDKTVNTVKNTKMWFGTFIDSQGNFFDTTHFPTSSPAYPFRGKGCYLILGTVVLDFGVPSIEVMKFAKLPIIDNPVLITK